MRMFLVVSCLLLVVSLVGCGEKLESTKYYYSPSWTQGGSIIFITGLQAVRKDAIGTQLGSSYTESVTTMDAAGTGENFLFDVTGAPPYAMSCAGDYAAYLDDLRDNLFRKIVVRKISGSVPWKGLDKAEILFSPGIVSFDWSKNGLKLVYCTTQEVRVRDWNDYTGATDTLVTAESNLEFVSWKYGDRIAFVYTVGSNKILSLIYPDGSGRIANLSAAASVDKPQISSANTNEVYGIAGGSYCSVEVSAGTPATVEVLANFKGDLPRLSPDSTKVIYSKTGEQSGIYIIDLTASTIAETKIK